jgi:hypothetical protein
VVHRLHSLVRRYGSSLERLLTALALSGLLYYLMRGLPAYPPNWDVVIAAVVFGAALGSPPLGYFLAVLAAVYPLYSLSIYLMALFLAAALLGQRFFINNLGGTLLILASPLLNAVYLLWSVPVLGGLWWGPWGGALIGGLSALWGQVLAGMTGSPLDVLARLEYAGNLPDLLQLIDRFAKADSFDTLWRLAEPFVPDSNRLLFYVLQIAVWAGVGALVGTLAEKPWAQQRRPWMGILIGWIGVLLLPVLTAGVGIWLGIFPDGPAVLLSTGRVLALSILLPGLLVSLLELLRNLFEYPMSFAGLREPAPTPVRSSIRSASRPAELSQSSEASKPASVNSFAPVSQDVVNSQDDEDKDDLVMLEID